MDKRFLLKISSFWTIWFPFIIGIIVILAFLVVMIFSSSKGMADLANWSSIAIIFLILPLLIFGIVSIVIMFFVLRGMKEFSYLLPAWLQKSSEFALKWLKRVQKLNESSIKPFIVAEPWFAGVGAATRMLYQKFKKHTSK